VLPAPSARYRGQEVVAAVAILVHELIAARAL
jgi:hypothetical protein